MCPVLFFVGPIPVATYGLVLLLAAAVCFLYVLPRLARIEGLDPKESAWRGFLGLFIALLSAKLTALVLGLPSFLADPRTLANLLFSGGVLYGGIVGALLYGGWMAVVWKIDLLKFLDIAGPTTTVGVAIGRWGCFFSGCCFGRPTDLPWGVHFGNRMAHLLHPDLPDRTPDGAPIYLHPTQIYDSLNMAIITAILLLYYPRKRVDGEVACLSLILYGIGRSIVETFRGDA